MTYDHLNYWRLADRLSVPTAAVLILGEDPAKNRDDDMLVAEMYFYDGYQAVFESLRTAIISGSLDAKLAYPTRTQLDCMPGANATIWLERGMISHQLDYDIILDLGLEEEWEDKIVIEREPDWQQTYIEVENLKQWLAKRGMMIGFFFPEVDGPDEDEIFNRKHEHFSAELALAVRAWRSLANVSPGRKSTKTLINEWIDDHRSAWLGDGALSAEAQKRIATVVNWKKAGGPPRSSDQ